MQDAWHRESLVLKGINTYYDRTQLSNFGGDECLGCGFIEDVYKNGEKLWYLSS